MDGNGDEVAKINGRLALLIERLKRALRELDESQLAELIALFQNPRRTILLSFLSGLARGVGIAIGFTAVGALIVYILGRLAALHLPLIGRFIAELMRIVQAELRVH